MKRFLITGAAILFVSGISAQKVKISGKTNFSEPAQKAYLYFSNNGERITDSAELKNGKFVFNEKVSEPTLATLIVQFREKSRKPERLGFYIEKGKVSISAKNDLESASIKGNKTQKEYEAMNNLKKPYDLKFAELNTAYSKAAKEKNTEATKAIQKEYSEISKEMTENVYKKFLTTHPDSYVSLYALNQIAGYDINPQVVEPLFTGLSAKLQNSASGKAFAQRIDAARKTSVGAMAMNFTQNDTLDKPVSLSDFRGKYVLVDFWASWCGPCRAENPNVVKAYNQFKDKNFTVLGVSLDMEGQKEAWMGAIHKDNLTWSHVSDLKGWDNAVAKEWGIRAVPQNFLIDPNGKIVAKNIRGEELNKKLSEILN